MIHNYERKEECKKSKNLPVHETNHHAGNDKEPPTSREILKNSNIINNYNVEANRKEDDLCEERGMIQNDESEVKSKKIYKYQIMRDKIFSEINMTNNNDNKKKGEVKERQDDDDKK